MLENIQISFDPLGFLGMLIAALVTIYTFKADIPFSYLQERHEKLIFPLFNCLEPVLYQPQSSYHLHQAILIIEKNKSFADGKLLNVYHNCLVDSSSSNFLNLCSYVDHAYDDSCRKLKLKRRSVIYRLNMKQYRDHRKLFLYIFLWTLPSVVRFIFCMFASLLFLAILFHLFKTASDLWQLIILGFFLPVFWIVIRKL